MDILKEWFEPNVELQPSGFICGDVQEELPSIG